MLLLHGARKLDADGIVDDFWMLAEGTRITAVGTGTGWRHHVQGERRMFEETTDAASVVPPTDRDSPSTPPTIEVVDAAGGWLTPGFIDLHGHGGGGFAFDDGADAIRSALAEHRAHGTTRSVISLVANPPHVLAASLDAIARLAADDPTVLGAHLEGPFLAPSRKGAHNPDFLGVPTRHVLKQLLEASEGRLVQVTIAPELPGALEAIDTFVASGVVVAVGHTDASLEVTREAFARGATLLTHAFNAMPGIHHRDPGPIVAAIDDDRVTLELIADGVHVHPATLEAAFRAAPGRIALITDAMAAAGAPDGPYRLGTLDVEVADGRALLAGTDTIAGSTLTQDAALRTSIAAGVDPVSAVTALTSTPARVLGRSHDLGRLSPGYLADAVLLSQTYEAQRVIAEGRTLP
ncbi:N-acetylglucosamine-6-phosphate deacetylase [Herbiconiux sp.]|uniref:N-acetylglucosamine-6-phosphate deacetylase n=1 Tax=Herbiconiux sp. TaxID=1871186 RepID=UPI0025C5C0F3|nr:N-acetylglucosamine-6-phosphate deacetylase [Herbiconiux sp.]